MEIHENPLLPVLTPDSPFPTFTSKVFPFHSQFSPFHSQFSLSFLTFPLLFPIFPLPFPVFRFLSHFPDFPVPISRSEPHKRRRNPGINKRKTGFASHPRTGTRRRSPGWEFQPREKAEKPLELRRQLRVVSPSQGDIPRVWF